MMVRLYLHTERITSGKTVPPLVGDPEAERGNDGTIVFIFTQRELPFWDKLHPYSATSR